MKKYFVLLYISLLISIIHAQDYSSLGSSKDVIISPPGTNRTHRFKQPTLCDSVTQYSGFIKVNPTTHYFFWFFESKQNPETAPLTLWLHGGPGCSSLGGLFKGVGPCRVNEDNTNVSYNERGSWNKVSNLLFIDQPAGAGFSHGDIVSSTEEVAPLVYRFLTKFFDAFPKYRNNPFHIFGESYAGHYIPSIANYIVKKNKKLTTENQNKKINLQSIGIGNGVIDVTVQEQYAQKMACNSTYGSVLNQTDCDLMLKNTPNCIQLLEKCNETGSSEDCAAATEYCSENLDKIYRHSGRRYYDVRNPINSTVNNYFKFVTKDYVKGLIGVPPNHHFHMCNKRVHEAFRSTGDFARDFSPFVTKLLNHEVRVLLYAGDADYRGSWYGILALTQQLNFKNSTIYRSSSLQPWIDQNGVEVGQYQSGGGLTFLRVDGAGHKVPVEKPEASYEMFLKHLAGDFH